MSNTRFVGKFCHRFAELPSTNDWAADLLNSSKIKPPEGTVVRADNQTAGRGQLGSRWQSPPGENLLLSVIFYPHWLEAQAQFYLSMAVALALRDAVRVQFGHDLAEGDVCVKWPNDLYIFGKKSAGILIQNTLSGGNLQSAVVGIGINVNQRLFPLDLPNATSLALAFGRPAELDTLAACLFEHLEWRYLQLKAGQEETIKNAYEANLWRRGAWSNFVRLSDAQVFEGQILGVSPQGLLRLALRDGGTAMFEVKQLAFV